MTEQEKQDDAAQPDVQATDPPAEAKAAEKAPAKAEKEKAPAAPAGPETAVVVQQHVPGTPVVSRRKVLQVGFWAGIGAAVAGAGACGIDMVYPTSVTGFGGTVTAGDVSEFPPGTKTEVSKGRFWIAHLTEEQGGPGLLALWWKCPHLGCTVPWKPTFEWPDPSTGANKQGWFRCPCHGSTYTDAGIRVFGPAPRSLDTFDLKIDGTRVIVDTGSVTPGGSDNPDRAVSI